MIDFFRIYYNLRTVMQFYIQNERKFKTIYKRIHKESHSTLHSIVAESNYLTYEIQEYKSFVYGSLKKFFYSMNVSTKNYNRDLTYSNLVESIVLLKNNTIDISKSNLSAYSLSFSIRTSIKGSEIIKNNILMYKLKGFNKDKIKGVKKELKLFEYENYNMGLFAFINGDDNMLYRINFQFQIKANNSFRKETGIYNIMDLKDKEKLKLLFTKFLKLYEEFIIVDGFDYECFSNKDKLKMKTYMNIDTWKNYSKSDSGRKSKSREAKGFKRIIKEYNLDNLKNEMRTTLEEHFNQFLSN